MRKEERKRGRERERERERKMSAGGSHYPQLTDPLHLGQIELSSETALRHCIHSGNHLGAGHIHHAAWYRTITPVTSLSQGCQASNKGLRKATEESSRALQPVGWRYLIQCGRVFTQICHLNVPVMLFTEHTCIGLHQPSSRHQVCMQTHTQVCMQTHTQLKSAGRIKAVESKIGEFRCSELHIWPAIHIPIHQRS